MKVSNIFRILFFGILVITIIAQAQETKESKKALDAFISATTKSGRVIETVPGAEIKVEILPVTAVNKNVVTWNGPAEKTQFDVILKEADGHRYITDEKGEFSIKLSEEQFKRFPEEAVFKFKIKPQDPSKYNYETDVVKIRVEKPKKPSLFFVVTYIKNDARTNKGTFAVSSKAQT